jgi:hypothetical protein
LPTVGAGYDEVDYLNFVVEVVKQTVDAVNDIIRSASWNFHFTKHECRKSPKDAENRLKSGWGFCVGSVHAVEAMKL